jgi:hypothetical protein
VQSRSTDPSESFVVFDDWVPLTLVPEIFVVVDETVEYPAVSMVQFEVVVHVDLSRFVVQPVVAPASVAAPPSEGAMVKVVSGMAVHVPPSAPGVLV